MRLCRVTRWWCMLALIARREALYASVRLAGRRWPTWAWTRDLATTGVVLARYTLRAQVWSEQEVRWGGASGPLLEARRRCASEGLTYAKAVRLSRRCRSVEERMEMFRLAACEVGASEHLASFALDGLASRGRVDEVKRFLGELEEVYGVAPSAVSYCILLKAIGRAASGRGSPSGRSFSSVSTKKTRALAGELAAVVAAIAARPNFVVDVVLVNALVDAYARLGRDAEAVRALDVVTGVEPPSSAFEVCLAAACRNVSSEVASSSAPREAAWRDAWTPGLERAFGAAIGGLARQGDMVGAFSLRRRMMEQHGLAPTALAEASLADGLARRGKPGLARRRLARLPPTACVEDQRARTAAYTALIRAWPTAHEAWASVAAMRAAGVEVNAHTYAEFFVACRRCPDPVERERLVSAAWRAMSDDRVRPTAVCYNAALSAYLSRDTTTTPEPQPLSPTAVRAALDLFATARADAAQRRCRASTSTLNALLSGLANDPATRPLAVRVFKRAVCAVDDIPLATGKQEERIGTRRRGLLEAAPVVAKKKKSDTNATTDATRNATAGFPVPDRRTYTIAVRILGRDGRLVALEKAVAALDRRFGIDTVALNTYLDALVKNGRLKGAVAALETHFDLADRVALTTVLDGLARSGSKVAPRKALALYDAFLRRHVAASASASADLDLGLAKATLRCCAALATDPAVRATRRVLEDARRHLEPADYAAARDFTRNLVFGATASELWKSKPSHGSSQNRWTLFKKRDWNTFDSGFRILF